MKCASDTWATAATARTSSGSAKERSMASRARSRRRLKSSTSRLTVQSYAIRRREVGWLRDDCLLHDSTVTELVEPTFPDVLAAAARIRPYLAPTPLRQSP